ncbi:aldehyde reductase 2 [Aspergillus udagawae]|uniref:Aldehyde reductase 2 n=1 Tax=Aspergillus udagawae TaxID=91492 RepID=A0A8H3S8L2_9EURO|nr:aldehyde reductase 2 [Aspergillus udagawae]
MLKGVETTIHLVGNIVISDSPEEILPSIKLVANVLEAAATKPSITRVVLASSSMAAYTPIPDQEGVIITADTWNDRAVQEAWDALPAQKSTTPDSQWKKRLAIYSACKTEMERQAWNWIIKNTPSFELSAVVGAFTVGRIIHRQIGGSMMGWVRGLLEGEKQPLLPVPPNIIQILRACQPSHPLIPDPPAEEGRDLAKILPRERTLELLRKWYGQQHWTPIAASIERALESQ